MTDKPAPEGDPEPETEVASEEAETPRKSASSKRSGLAVGAAAVGIGSAAVVAALLYVRHRKGRG